MGIEKGLENTETDSGQVPAVCLDTILSEVDGIARSSALVKSMLEKLGVEISHGNYTAVHCEVPGCERQALLTEEYGMAIVRNASGICAAS